MADSLYLTLASASARSMIDSRRLFVLRSVGEISLIAAETAAPLVLAGRYGSVAGWTAAEVCLLVGLSRAGQGLAYLAGRGLEPAAIGEMVRSGRFDQVLIRPVHPLPWLMTVDVQVRFLFRFLAGLVIGVAGATAAGVQWTPTRVSVLVLAIVASAILTLAILVVGAALTLFVGEGSEAALLLADGGLAMVGFPLELYGSVLRFAFTFLVPAALCVYVPALVVLDRSGVAGIDGTALWLLPPVLGAFCGAALLAWRVGLRHYRSTGS